MDPANIVELILSEPSVAKWPEMVEFIQKAGDKPKRDWSLPIVASQAVCGDPEPGYIGAAAIACLQASIILVDDILDEETDGEYRRIGPGRAANLSMGLLSTAFKLLSSYSMKASSPPSIGTIIANLSGMITETARGQELDVAARQDESAYWETVKAKSTPFYGAALQLGSLLGGANRNQSEEFWDLGVLAGEIIQLNDDLIDVMDSPPKPDWVRPYSNIVLLHALTSDHSDRDEFERLLSEIPDDSALRKAQQTLFKSGSVSFCALQIARRYELMRELIGAMELKDPDVLLNMLKEQATPLEELFRIAGVESPEELIN
jgi:geranylgeranyl pyrophosphate synthase